jgi:hypothetical protein
VHLTRDNAQTPRSHESTFHIAKVRVASSNLVARSNENPLVPQGVFLFSTVIPLASYVMVRVLPEEGREPKMPWEASKLSISRKGRTLR